ncbi:ribonuclease BN [Streptomyces diacarni]|uniref:Ribonuclease BN n=1 Tax=Streptomyces diacarni TaxID=2800381 RepID=A0A367F920_9ACTN|nr:ribonuclease BN [Streptomyces diacarni]RCG26751.1 ribonuclease BN [Streptomyces diacarni]
MFGRWPTWKQRVEQSLGGRLWQHGTDFELMRRAMAFGMLGFVSMVPLLIVVAALDPVHHAGFEQWIVNGMGLDNPTAAHAVHRLFSAPQQVISTTSVLSAVLLGVFGLSFAASVQSSYELIWALPPGRWHKLWRQVVWLAAITAFLFAEVESEAVLRQGTAQVAVRVFLTVLFGVLFFWWGQYLLLGSRIRWAALFPGAVATMVGLGGLRVFSSLVFSPLIVSSTKTNGPAGTLLIVQSWLIGVGFVVLGGPLAGHNFHVWRVHRRRRVAAAREEGG